MTKLLTITKTAWMGFLVALIAAFVMAVTTHAQTPPATAAASPTDEHEEAARKHGVTFPIADLGGCTDYSACRNYCEDPVNATACINYGKQKGFYKEESFEVNNKILETAKSVLGCDSKTSCLNFCEVPANRDKCDSFAKGQGLVGGLVEDPSKTQVISRAREVLGCDSATGCQSLCSQEANRQKCSDFAKTVGLHGGEHKVGPGGCTSEGTCKSFCSDPANYQVCSGFTSVAGGQFKGPGGCDSEASCRAYCQTREKECSQVFGGPGTGGTIQTKYDPVDMCNRTPNCSWTGNNCQCGFYGETTETTQKAGEYAGFCRANPDKCKPGQTGGFDTTAQRQEFENYCSQNPDKCKPPTGGTGGTPGDVFDPATKCARYGCSWTGSSCQCGGIKDYNPVEQCNRTPNCSWTGDHCQCGPYSYPTPYSGGQYSPSPYAYPTPGGSYSYPTPYTYSYPTPGGTYSYPTPYSGTYSYPTPYSGTYSYPTPYSGTYSYPTPYSGGYSYPTPYSYSYPTPHAYSYPTPQAYSYPTPQAYSYPTPEAYSYPTPQAYSYPTPSGGSLGVSTSSGLWYQILDWLRR